ncbi:transcriptional activator protein UGA3 [Microdochium nivale]|nr:transcriptional activator protein UGA3 [Microdochium nivale]
MAQPPTSSKQNGNSASTGTRRASKRRVAAPKTRSRNGCSACKTRRLKCDEARPACLACVRGNRPCPGYRKAFRWSTKHEASLGCTDDGVHELPYAEVNSALNVLSSSAGRDEPQQNPKESTRAIGYVSLTDTDDCELPDTASQRRPSNVDTDERYPCFDDFAINDLDQTPQVTTTDTWHIPDEDILPLLHEEIVLEDNGTAAVDLMVVPFSDVRMTRSNGKNRSTNISISRALNNYSTMLVEEWFKHVCPMFSCFDSDANLNRMLAQECWTRSVAVNSSLQSMAAICLATQMPFMRRVAASHLSNAISAIEADLHLVRHSIETSQLHTDLLLALCCVGTTACWINTSDTGTHYLREAKTLFRRALRSTAGHSPAEEQRLQYFNNSLVYWNMLVSVVSDTDSETDVGVSPRALSFSSSTLKASVVPHPWTGTSAPAQALLGRAIRLCRLFRLRFKRNMKMTALNLEAALSEIRQAQQIEEELLALEHLSIDKIMETGDKLSPRAHFYHVAEAYRLASLLQLYQTFPDLVTRRLPEQATDSSGYVPWDKWIVPLCLRLVEVLRQIPVSSGTRCIQPLLYITACTGLRFDQATLAQSRGLLGVPSSMGAFPLLHDPMGLDTMQVIFGLGNNENLSTSSLSANVSSGSSSITALSLEVTHARQFILGRLGILEHSLPPAPIRVAQDLVKAIWAGYDEDADPTRYTHWIDIMEKSNLQTIFG